MSRLYGDMTSDTRKKATTTRGHNYVESHIRSWDVGVKSTIQIIDNEVHIDVALTGGSNEPKKHILVFSMGRQL